VATLSAWIRHLFTMIQNPVMTARQLQMSAIRRWPFWGPVLSTGFVPALLLIGMVLGLSFWI
jgi:hypothetical protein